MPAMPRLRAAFAGQRKREHDVAPRHARPVQREGRVHQRPHRLLAGRPHQSADRRPDVRALLGTISRRTPTGCASRAPARSLATPAPNALRTWLSTARSIRSARRVRASRPRPSDRIRTARGGSGWRFFIPRRSSAAERRRLRRPIARAARDAVGLRRDVPADRGATDWRELRLAWADHRQGCFSRLLRVRYLFHHVHGLARENVCQRRRAPDGRFEPRYPPHRNSEPGGRKSQFRRFPCAAAPKVSERRRRDE